MSDLSTPFAGDMGNSRGWQSYFENLLTLTRSLRKKVT
jgi:hypothetical protein